MTDISFETARNRLRDALPLFCEMVEAHQASSGDRRFMLSEYMTGNSLSFFSKDAQVGWKDVDPSSLNDLANYGLLQLSYGSRGTPNYRISADGSAFYRWLREQQGSALEQTEDSVARFLESDRFASAHPAAAHHLAEAFSLLWIEPLNTQVISEMGDHLRKALMDLVADLVGSDDGRVESPAERLDAWLPTRGLQQRELAVVRQLVELAKAVLRLDHRLNHVRDEMGKGESPPSREEARRAAFVTATVCFELSRLS